MGAGIHRQDRRDRADPAAGRPDHGLAGRAVQHRREGFAGDRATGRGAAGDQRLGPRLPHLVLWHAAEQDAPAAAATPAGIGAIRAGLPRRVVSARFDALSVRCAQIPFSMATPRFIARAHACGLQVHTWTVNDRAIMASLLDLGVDGIMTDHTETLRDLLISRGQWQPRAGG
jgi:hypothetical protein